MLFHIVKWHGVKGVVIIVKQITIGSENLSDVTHAEIFIEEAMNSSFFHVTFRDQITR